MYNPTNTRCQIMSYRDTGAPTLKATNRDALFPWLQTLFSTGYNFRNVVSITSDGTQITINFSDTAYGYTLGQLLKVSGATESVFNKLWRVQSVHETSVKCNIVDNEIYPATATGTITSIVSSLDWEFVFTNENQVSMRSKMDNSSKSIITFKKPTGSLLKDKGAVVYEVEVSKNINPTTGFITDSLTSPYNINDNGLSVSSFYFIQSVYSTSLITTINQNLANQDYNIPWHIIGDGRIFYIIIGCMYSSTGLSTTGNVNSINYSLENTLTMTRLCYFFGDYNSFNEQNTINGNELIINFPQYSSTAYSRGEFNEYALGLFETRSMFSLKSYMGLASKEAFRPNSIGVKTSFYNFYNSGLTTIYSPFPNPGVNGYLFFPIYLQDSLHNYRGELPYTKLCPQSSSFLSGNNTSLLSVYDKREVLDNGEIFTKMPGDSNPNSNSNYTFFYIFNLGI